MTSVTASGLLRVDVLAAVLTLSAGSSLTATSWQARPSPHASNASDSLVTIGVADGDDRLVFGQISDVVVTPYGGGTIVLLDRQTLMVSAFDFTGGFRGRAGGAGAGPGEFRAPVSLTTLEQGGVAVLDAAHRRITTLALDETGLHFEQSFQIPLFGNALCHVADRWIVLAWHDEMILHEVDSTGIRRSFGSLLDTVPSDLRAHAQLFADVASRGRLVCFGQPGTIVVLPEQSPLVRAFAVNGEELWRQEIPGFHRRRWEPDGRGVRMAADPASGTAHTGLALGQRADGQLVATLHEGSLSDPVGHLEWRVLDRGSGAERARAVGKAIFVATFGDRVITYVNDPFPMILVRPLE